MAFWSGKKDKVELDEQTGSTQNNVEQGWSIQGKSGDETAFTTGNSEGVERKSSFISNRKACKREKVVPSGISLTGQVSFDSAVKIDGQINGELFSASTVTVGLMGELSGMLEADVFDVYGKVNGELRARNKIILRNGAEVTAKLLSPKLEIEEGAYLEGDVLPLLA